jgi:antitoxin component YwqK of YwqJK toxin-antitoxin module
MSQEIYTFENDQIQVVDSDLGIDLKEKFVAVRIPEELKEGVTLEDGCQLRVVQDEEGVVEEAYIEKGERFHGQYRLFYPSGSVKGESFYQEGELHGPSEFYGENGEVLAQTWYLHGKQQGKVHQYYLSGKVYSVQKYIDGNLDGVQEYFYEDGTLKTKMPYSAGQLHGLVQLFFANGQNKRRDLCGVPP